VIPQPEPVQPEPAQPVAPAQDTGAQMEAILNEAGGTQTPAWPGATGN
jgi:hypothetical protein